MKYRNDPVQASDESAPLLPKIKRLVTFQHSERAALLRASLAVPALTCQWLVEGEVLAKLPLSLGWSVLYPLTITGISVLMGKAYFAGGVDDVKCLLRGRAPSYSMNTLVSLSGLGLLAYAPLALYGVVNNPHSHYRAVILTLAALALSDFFKQRINRNINSQTQDFRQVLKSLMVAKTHLLTDDGTELVETTKIKVQQRIKVLTGERFPVDCQLLDSAWIDDGTLRQGESDAVLQHSGTLVYAGTRNAGAAVHAVVVKTQRQSFLQVMAAEFTKHRPKFDDQTTQVANNLIRYFVPGILITAAFTFMAWSILQDVNTGFLCAVNVIVAACPCTLSIANSAGPTFAKKQLLRDGIILRHQNALTNLLQSRYVIFDKTGTLTQPAVADINYLSKGNKSQIKALIYAAQRARLSKNPRDQYATLLCQKLSQDIVNIENVVIIENEFNGVCFTHQDKTYYMGNKIYLEKANIQVPAESSTVIWLADEDNLIAILRFKQQLHPAVPMLVKTLKQNQCQIEIVTGDHTAATLPLAQKLGVSFHADMTPEKKRDHIEALKKQHNVTMVGDGLNDAMAMQSANCAIGVKRTALASGKADIVVENIAQLIPLLQASQLIHNNHLQSIGIALSYNIAMMLLMAFIIPAYGSMPDPAIAGVAMAASSLVVLLWSSRLFKQLKAMDLSDVNHYSFFAEQAVEHEREIIFQRGVNDYDDYRV